VQDDEQFSDQMERRPSNFAERTRRSPATDVCPPDGPEAPAPAHRGRTCVFPVVNGLLGTRVEIRRAGLARRGETGGP